jgi:gas vesicle protein
MPTTKFGETLKDQMEERLKFLASGTKPRKNKDVMKEVIDQLKDEGLFYGDKIKLKKDDDDVKMVESLIKQTIDNYEEEEEEDDDNVTQEGFTNNGFLTTVIADDEKRLQIGNAVPPLLGKAIGESILNAINTSTSVKAKV